MGRRDTYDHTVRNTYFNCVYISKLNTVSTPHITYPGYRAVFAFILDAPLSCRFWGKGQPNSYDGRNQDCVEFWHRATGNGDWNDENCNIEQNWICEM